MTAKQVEERLTEFVHQEPFVPFVVEMTDGKCVTVPHPPAFDESGAGFINSDGVLADFSFANVRAFCLVAGAGVMMPEELDASLKAFGGRRPFQYFLIEFTSGMQIQVKHPEAVRRHGSLYVSRAPDHGFVSSLPPASRGC